MGCKTIHFGKVNSINLHRHVVIIIPIHVHDIMTATEQRVETAVDLARVSYLGTSKISFHPQMTVRVRHRNQNRARIVISAIKSTSAGFFLQTARDQQMGNESESIMRGITITRILALPTLH